MKDMRSFIRWLTAGLIFILGWGVVALTVYLLFAVVWAEKVWIALAGGVVTTGFGFFFIFRGFVKLSECALWPKLELLPDEELDNIVSHPGSHSEEKIRVARNILTGRKTAVEAILDQEQLLRIVTNDPDAFRRRSALEQLSDPSALAKIAREHADPAIRSTAMEKANDQRLFAEVACHDRDAQLQAKALAKLYDPELLAGIIGSDTRPEIQLAALNALTSADKLKEVIKTHADRRVRKAARHKLFSKFSWIEPFCGICGKDVNEIPVLTHKLSGIVCCESCGLRMGGPGGMIQAARQAVECACGFQHIPGHSTFDACPSCQSKIAQEQYRVEESQSGSGGNQAAIPDDYFGCVRLLKSLAAAADARNAATFEECPEYEAIRNIGERLFALGGLRLMQQAFSEVRGSEIYFSQDWWDKIGTWRS